MHQGHGAFLLASALDAENFERSETRWKPGSRNDPEAGFSRLSLGPALSSFSVCHGEPRIIAGAPRATTLYIGTAIG